MKFYADFRLTLFFVFLIVLSTSQLTLAGIESSNKPEELTQRMIRETSVYDQNILNDRHNWVAIGFQGDSNLAKNGLALGAGHRYSFFGFDLRLLAGQTKYSAIRASPNDTDDTSSPAVLDASAEINRPRGDNDDWTYYSLETGISVSGKMFANDFPLLSETARVGIGFGGFRDNANNINFSVMYLVTYEAMAAYQFNRRSPWAMTTSLALTHGFLNAKPNADQPESNQRRLPIGWVNFSLGLQYSM